MNTWNFQLNNQWNLLQLIGDDKPLSMSKANRIKFSAINIIAIANNYHYFILPLHVYGSQKPLDYLLVSTGRLAWACHNLFIVPLLMKDFRKPPINCTSISCQIRREGNLINIKLEYVVLLTQ